MESVEEVLDSGFRTVDSRYFVSGTGIPDFIVGFQIPWAVFHKQKFPEFRIPHAEISRILDSGFPYMEQQLSHYSLSF